MRTPVVPPPQSRTRLSIDVSAEARRRIRIAAARRDQSIREYVWDAVAARLDRDAPPLSSEAPARKGSVLTERADPVLADLWKNAEDAVYDDL